MKYPILILISIMLIPTHHIYSTQTQEFEQQLNLLEQTLNEVIVQSDMDPEIAQDLINNLNILHQIAQHNLRQDIKDIHAATALSCILETSTGILKNTPLAAQLPFITSFKYSARSNAIHKYIMGMYPGKLSNQSYYTNPYIESIGFTLNDWIFTYLTNLLFNAISQSSFGKNNLSLDTIPQITQRFIIRMAAGISAHYAWLLEKKAFFTANNIQQNTFGQP